MWLIWLPLADSLFLASSTCFKCVVNTVLLWLPLADSLFLASNTPKRKSKPGVSSSGNSPNYTPPMHVGNTSKTSPSSPSSVVTERTIYRSWKTFLFFCEVWPTFTGRDPNYYKNSRGVLVGVLAAGRGVIQQSMGHIWKLIGFEHAYQNLDVSIAQNQHILWMIHSAYCSAKVLHSQALTSKWVWHITDLTNNGWLVCFCVDQVECGSSLSQTYIFIFVDVILSQGKENNYQYLPIYVSVIKENSKLFIL